MGQRWCAASGPLSEIFAGRLGGPPAGWRRRFRWGSCGPALRPVDTWPNSCAGASPWPSGGFGARFPLRDSGCPLRGSAGDFPPVAGSDRRWLAFLCFQPLAGVAPPRAGFSRICRTSGRNSGFCTATGHFCGGAGGLTLLWDDSSPLWRGDRVGHVREMRRAFRILARSRSMVMIATPKWLASHFLE